MQQVDHYGTGVLAGKKYQVSEYILTETRQGSSLIEQQLIFFRAYHDAIAKNTSIMDALTEKKREKLQNQMTSLDELIKECSSAEFYAQINTIVELAEMQESKINKLSTLQKMITQLLKSAKKKDKKQNDSE